MIVMGDLNAKVRLDNSVVEYVVGRHGVGFRHDNGSRFADFCSTHHLVIGGTLLVDMLIRSITWPGSPWRKP